jgi:Ribosomal proteins 50S-L15, 50S-L18e, 60S-L27A
MEIFSLGQAPNLAPSPFPLPPIDITVSRASASAIEAIEAAGGKIQCRYHNMLGMRALLRPESLCVLFPPFVAIIIGLDILLRRPSDGEKI